MEHKIGDIFYRYELMASYDPPMIMLRRMFVIRTTKSAVWLGETWLVPQATRDGGVSAETAAKHGVITYPGAISAKWKPTVELAWKSFKIRTLRRKGYLQRDLEACNMALGMDDTPPTTASFLGAQA
jgi:hypothetical protein